MLLATLKHTQSALLSLFILTLGLGLLMTLLPLRLHHAHVSVLLIGLITTAYYAGLILGSFRIEPFIQRVGHIRAFSAFASAFGVVCLLQGLWPNPWIWVFLRFISGICTAVLFIVIESWLLSKSTLQTRGQILALYMIALYAAQAAGQFFLSIGTLTFIPFAIVSMLASLSVIPLAVTKAPSPTYQDPSPVRLKTLYTVSPSGFLGSFISGLGLSAIYGLMPLFFAQLKLSTHTIATLTAIIIFGGMCFQYPIGRLSDKTDRRLVLLAMSIATVMSAISIMVFAEQGEHTLLYIASFLLGGFIFTLYPLSISQLCDQLKADDIVAGTQGLLLIYSVGATIGPLVATVFMHAIFFPYGLLLYFCVLGLALTGFLLWRKSANPVLPDENAQAFVNLPQTTPIAAELDPRSDEDTKLNPSD